MIFADLSDYKNKITILNIIKKKILILIKMYTKQLEPILQNYSDDQIERSVDSISLAGNKIFCPTTNLEGRILRSIEYGTGQTKAYNIISMAIKKVLLEVKANGHI